MKVCKKLFVLLLVLSLVLTATACGNQTENTTSTTQQYNNDIVENTQTGNDIAPVETSTDTVVVTDTITTTVSQNETQTTATQSTASDTETTTAATTQPTTQAPSAPEITDGVGKYTSNYKSVEQAVYYPAELVNSNYTYPIIAFANGTMVSYTFYETLLKEFAKCGYIVVGNGETMSADGTAQIASIDFIISENNNPSSVLYGKVNTDKIATVGHSQGGRSSVNAAAADSRIDCVLSIAGSNYVEEAEKLSTPTLFMAGTKDMIVDADKWVKTAYDAAKGPAVYVNYVGGIHTTCCTSPEPYIYYASRWLDYYLYDNSSCLDTFRDGGELANDSSWTEFACKNI